jgi:hypothetical protein
VKILETTNLTITNFNQQPIRVRCSSRRTDIFQVEVNLLQMLLENCVFEANDVNEGSQQPPANHSRKSNRNNARNEILVPPQASLQYTILFTPQQVDKLYDRTIDFLINDTALVKVNVKGAGTMPTLISLNNKQVNFSSVAVGNTATKTIILQNTSKKDLLLNLESPSVSSSLIVSGAQKAKEITRGTFAGRGITIHPDCFVIRKLSSVEVQIKFTPSIALPSNELPLKFNICNGLFTVATIKTRSHFANPEMPISSMTSVVVERSPSHHDLSIPLDEPLLSSPMSLTPRVAESTKSGRYDSAFPKGLRPLAATECICSNKTVIRRVLSTSGWVLNGIESRLCLVYQPTGLFIDIPQRIGNSGPTSETLAENSDSISIDVMCAVPFCYEIVYFGIVLQSGFALGLTPTEVVISLAVLDKAIELLQESQPGNQSIRHQYYGVQALSVNVYSPKKVGLLSMDLSSKNTTRSVHEVRSSNEYEKDELYSISQVMFVRGFIITTTTDNVDKTPTNNSVLHYMLRDRLDVSGVYKIDTHYGQGAAVMHERFDKMFHHNGCHDGHATEIFRPLTISINAPDDASYLRVTDRLQWPEQTVETAHDRQYFLQSSMKEDMIYLDELDLPHDHPSLLHARRSVLCDIIREDPNFKKKSTNDQHLRRFTMHPHSVQFATLDELAIAAQQWHRMPSTFNNALPLAVQSSVHSIGISMKRVMDSDDLLPGNEEFTAMQFQLRNGYDHEIDGSVFLNGEWVLLLDGTTPKLVVADPTIIEEDDLVIHHSTKSPPSVTCPTFELQLHAKGLLVKTASKDRPFDVYFVDRVLHNKRLRDLSLDNRELKYYNGHLHLPLQADKEYRFLNSAYAIDTRGRTLRRIQESFRRFADRSDVELAVLQQKYEQPNDAGSGMADNDSGPSRLYQKAYYLLHEQSLEYCLSKKAIEPSSLGAFTSKRLHIPKLIKFLSETVPYPWYDKPLGPSEIFLLVSTIPSNEFGTVVVDDFVVWCEQISFESTNRLLNERSVYARLLHQEIDSVLRWQASKHGNSQLHSVGQNENSLTEHETTQRMVVLESTAAALHKLMVRQSLSNVRSVNIAEVLNTLAISLTFDKEPISCEDPLLWMYEQHFKHQKSRKSHSDPRKLFASEAGRREERKHGLTQSGMDQTHKKVMFLGDEKPVDVENTTVQEPQPDKPIPELSSEKGTKLVRKQHQHERPSKPPSPAEFGSKFVAPVSRETTPSGVQIQFLDNEDDENNEPADSDDESDVGSDVNHDHDHDHDNNEGGFASRDAGDNSVE